MTSLVAAVIRRQFEMSLRRLVAMSKVHLQQTLMSTFRFLPCHSWLPPRCHVFPQAASDVPKFASVGLSEKLLLFSEQSHGDDSSSSGGSGDNKRKYGPVRLMDYKKLRWPNPINTVRNYIFSTLIKISFDREFSMHGFLDGAAQVI